MGQTTEAACERDAPAGGPVVCRRSRQSPIDLVWTRSSLGHARAAER